MPVVARGTDLVFEKIRHRLPGQVLSRASAARTKVAGEKAEARLSLREDRLIVEVVSTADGTRGAYLFRTVCRERADAERQMGSVRGWILKEMDATEKLARARWSDLP